MEKENMNIIPLPLIAFRSSVRCVCLTETSPTTTTIPLTLTADLVLLETSPLPLGHALLQVGGLLLANRATYRHIINLSPPLISPDQILMKGLLLNI